MQFLSILLVVAAVTRSVRVEARSPDKFEACLNRIRTGDETLLKHPDYPIKVTDDKGAALTGVNVANAVGLGYETCVNECGGEQEPFEWSIFSRQFGSWMLPWLALVSQLPFGSKDRLANLESVFLTLGSPTLAAYSLSLTIPNSRWISRRFSKYTYPNVRNAVRALGSLQQAPIRLARDPLLLASLVILPQNDKWWKELIEWLQYPHTWSISAVSSVAWVVIAYVFTVVDSFTGNLAETVSASGQSVGSLWLWLLPIVIGWLQVSPKCDEGRLLNAMDRANLLAHVATKTSPVLVRELPHSPAIYLAFTEDDSLRCDEKITAPIYNYARFLPWVDTVETISDIFRAASQQYHLHQSVDPLVQWMNVDPGEKPHEENRAGSRSQVGEYCGMPEAPSQLEADTGKIQHRGWGSNVFSRMATASALAMFLTWGTVGAAIVVIYFTPTTGLGCRSASYVLFGALSTLVWVMLLVSSILARFAMNTPDSLQDYPGRGSWPRAMARRLSIALRRLGKLVAAFNAMCLVATCLFQFSNFYNRCYCNSSVFGRGQAAFNVVDIAHVDLSGMRSAWVGGTCLAAATASVFVGFVVTFINPPLPKDLH